MEHQTININVQHEKKRTDLSLPNNITLHQLCHEYLNQLTTISSSTHQLIFKLILNKPPTTLVSPGNSDDKTLCSLGLNHAHKILLITTKLSEIKKSKQINQIEKGKQAKREESLLKKTIKVRDTSKETINSTESLKYKFHSISIDEDKNLPHNKKRLNLLKLLSNNSSIQKQMIRFNLTVLHLGELHPSNNPNLLGLNINFGQSIRLRLLTDDLLSVRPFYMVRKVLAHELAHNRFGSHDNKFKEFNSQIYKGMIEQDAIIKANTYTLGGEYYEPEEIENQIDNHCETNNNNLNQTLSNQIDHQSSVVLDLDLDPRLAAANAALKRASNNQTQK